VRRQNLGGSSLLYLDFRAGLSENTRRRQENEAFIMPRKKNGARSSTSSVEADLQGKKAQGCADSLWKLDAPPRPGLARHLVSLWAVAGFRANANRYQAVLGPFAGNSGRLDLEPESRPRS
jgi:hypothetical protein